MIVNESRTKWIPILACALCLAVGGNPIAFAPWSLFMAPITQEFGWTRTQFFSAMSLATIFATVALPFIGQVVDRRGVRVVALAGIIGFAGVIVALSQMNGSVSLYLALMAFLGVVVMMHGPLPYSRVVVEAAGARRGMGLAVALSGSTLGLVLVPQLVRYLIEHQGWRVAEMTLAAVVLIVAFPTAWLFIGRRSSGVTGAAESMRAPLPPMPWEELRSPLFWTLAIAFLLNAIAVNAFMGHVAGIATEHGLSASVAATAISVSGLGLAAARFIAGFMLDKSQSPQVGQMWFWVGGVALVTAAFGQGASSVIIAAALVGATLGAEVELISYFTSRFYPPGLYGRMYGLLYPFFMLGVSLGPLVFAMLFDATKSYQLGLCLMAGAEVLGALLLLLVGNSYRYQVNGGPMEPRSTTMASGALSQSKA